MDSLEKSNLLPSKYGISSKDLQREFTKTPEFTPQ